MRENEFDKGVKELMGEFRLQPSAQVWPEVERRIRERKRRRILIFWFLLAGVLLGAAGTWWYIQSGETTDRKISTTVISQQSGIDSFRQHENINRPAAIEKSTDLISAEKKITAPATTTVQSVPAEKLAVSKAIPKTPGSSPVVYPADINTVNNPLNKTQKQPTRKYPANKPKPVSVTDGASIATTASLPNPVMPAVLIPQPVVTADSADRNRGVVSVSQSMVPVVANTDSQLTAKPAIVTDTVSTAVPPVATKNKKAAARKWETGLAFSAGFTRLTSGSIAGFGNAEKNFDAMYASPVGTNSSFYNNSPLIRYADTIPLYGWAWQAGVYAKRKTGKRTAFSAGMNIGFYSSWQTVGAFKDSSRIFRLAQGNVESNSYYLSGTENKYSNRYYYLQFPLLFHWQLNKARKGPALQWENGLMPVWLAGSRAIIYDRNDRMYYTDKKAYNRLGLAFQTGMSFRFAPQHKPAWSAGIYYNFHISQLQKMNQPAYNNLSSFGLQLRRSFKK